MSCEHDIKFRVYEYNDADGETYECLACSLKEEEKHNVRLLTRIFKLEDTLRDFAREDFWYTERHYGPHGEDVYDYIWDGSPRNPIELAESVLGDE